MKIRKQMSKRQREGDDLEYELSSSLNGWVSSTIWYKVRVINLVSLGSDFWLPYLWKKTYYLCTSDLSFEVCG